MLKTQSLALSGMLFAITILPSLVNGFDCMSISSSTTACGRNSDSDSDSDSESESDYPLCMVQTSSISVFIQCASQNDPPMFGVGFKSISASEVLTQAVVSDDNSAIPAPACEGIPLATNILKAVKHHGSKSLVRYLCENYQPLNLGLCGLRNCLKVGMGTMTPEERDIEAFCASDMQDLTKAGMISCADSADSSSTGSEPSSGGAGSTDSSESNAPSSESTHASSPSTGSTTPPMANSPTPTSATRSSSSPQARGAASRRWESGFGSLSLIGLAVFLIHAA